MKGVEDLWYGSGPAASAGRALLAPLSAVFGAAAAARGVLYDRGLLRSEAAPGPVVSVGGLRVGGAGKTPFVLWLAAGLKARGLRPCLVTRGYGGTGQGRSLRVLQAGATGLHPDTVAEVGDEAAMLALRSGCPVAVGANRLEACRAAGRELAACGESPSLFLLDDGFQHRALRRDLDVVLVDGREEGEALLPAGPLREGPPALVRADVVVVLGSGTAPTPAFAGQTVLHAEVRPTAVVASVADAGGDEVGSLSGRRVVAVAAIARPGRFLADLERAGAVVVATVLRRDHHRFDDADLAEIGAVPADLVVTTEKDLVKLGRAEALAPRLRALRIDVRVDGGEALLERIAAVASI